MLPLQLSSSCVVQCCTSSGAWLMVLAKATPPQDRLMRWEWDHLQHAPGSQKKSIKREANITKLKECWHMLTLVLAMHSLLLGSCWFQETARALRIPLHWHSLKQHWESSQADMFLRALDPSQASCRVVIHGRITDIPQTPLASIAAAPHQQPLLGQLDVPPICAMWGFHGGIFQGYPRPHTSESTRRAQESWASKKLWFWLFLWNDMPQLCSLH